MLHVVWGSIFFHVDLHLFQNHSEKKIPFSIKLLWCFCHEPVTFSCYQKYVKFILSQDFHGLDQHSMVAGAYRAGHFPSDVQEAGWSSDRKGAGQGHNGIESTRPTRPRPPQLHHFLRGSSNSESIQEPDCSLGQPAPLDLIASGNTQTCSEV